VEGVDRLDEPEAFARDIEGAVAVQEPNLTLARDNAAEAEIARVPAGRRRSG
jgi:hypothetical protein